MLVVMSDPANWPQIRRPMHPPIQPPTRPARRLRRLLLILAVLVLVSLSGRMWLSYYVDALWFESLGYAQVFWKTLSLQSTVFISFTASTFLILYGAFLALKRTHFTSLPGSHTIFIGGQPLRLPVGSALRLLVVAGSAVIAVATGAVMMAEWPTFALYWYAPRANTGVADPIFGKPPGFYL